MPGGPLVLSDGRGRVEVHPAMGAGVGRYDAVIDGRTLDIFRPDAARSGVFALGCNLLLPFSNRISGGGFWHDGRFHPLEPNFPGNPYPIHGNALTETWTVVQHEPDRAVLGLSSIGPGPFRYDAEVSYTLADGALTMALRARNTAHISLPFGIGFHPWFARTPRTRLEMTTAGVWSEDEAHLPIEFHPVGSVPRFDFSRLSTIPGEFLNNAFTGWDGSALLDWPERNCGVRITSGPPLTTIVLYSPSSDAGFVCVEPVSHSIDAHNRRDPGSSPPQVLLPGETLEAAMTLATVAV